LKLQQSVLPLVHYHELYLRGLTNGQLVELIRCCRVDFGRRIDEADAGGDGPMVNALCAEARKWFTAGLRW
jgi:hypothetical protein